MPEVTIKYKSAKSLEALKDFSKYFDFEITMPRTPKTDKDKENVVINGNGVTTETLKDLTALFSATDMDAKKLRKSWKRNK